MLIRSISNIPKLVCVVPLQQIKKFTSDEGNISDHANKHQSQNNPVQDIIENFQPIDGCQNRLMKIMEYGIKEVLIGGQRGRTHANIIGLNDLTSDHFIQNLLQKMKLDTMGEEILRNRPRISDGSVHIEELRELPPNSFGYNVGEFLVENDLNVYDVELVRHIEDIDLAYVMQRSHEIRYYLHVLLNLDYSLAGQTALKWFEMVHYQLPGSSMLALAGPLFCDPSSWSGLITNIIPQTIQNAKNSQLVLNLYFEQMFQNTIEEVRESCLGIKPFVNH